MNLQSKINELERQISDLKSMIYELTINDKETYNFPFSKIGMTKNDSEKRPIDIKSGKSLDFSGAVIWNSVDAQRPPLNEEPELEKIEDKVITEGYNKHTHSRYAGGALINGILEIIEYKPNSYINPHNQQFWIKEPEVAKVNNSKGEPVEKIGTINFSFDADSKTWGTQAFEIDVTKCYLVKRRKVAEIDENTGNPIAGKEAGTIETDSKGQEMKSPLYVTKPDKEEVDITKTSVIWDENGKCWRFIAVYAYEPGA